MKSQYDLTAVFYNTIDGKEVRTKVYRIAPQILARRALIKQFIGGK